MSSSTLRRLVTTAAYSTATLIGAGAAVAGVSFAQGVHVKRTIGVRRTAAPYADGHYGPRKSGSSERFVMLGDSVAAGLGAGRADATPGAMLAQGISNVLDRPVRYFNMSTVGARSADLASQVERALQVRPNVAVIIIGGNDVTHLTPIGRAVNDLERGVEMLRAAGCQVVVGACPDVGTVQPMRPPLRQVARLLSRKLAAEQMAVSVRAGAHAVSLWDELGEEFKTTPDLFAEDRFHPGPQGYERLAQVLFPVLMSALDARLEEMETSGQLVPLSQAALSAADDAGLHLEPAGRGPRGRWALIRRVRRRPMPTVEEHTPADIEAAQP